ncbi:MAG: hypothetical protein WA957_12130, partial [Alteraurantiacibacter sp.]
SPLADASDRLSPRGEPLGPAVAASASPVPTERSGELPPVGAATTQTPSPEVVPVLTQATPPAPAASEQSPPPATVVTSQPAFVDAGESRPSVSVIESAPQPSAEPETVDLASAFADFTLERGRVPSAQGAVDITAIKPPREIPAPAAPKAPVHPSRQWVQVATGQDTTAFRFDWRRIVRGAGGLLDDAEVFTARWGQTNRLLTGPFETAQAAQAMVSELAGKGVDSFRFSSEEGEEIQQLD